MAWSDRDTEFSAFVQHSRVDLLRSACLLSAGDTHLAEDLVQTALSRLYLAWPRVARAQAPLAYARRCVVNAFLDETRRSRWRRERPVAEPALVAARADELLVPGADHVVDGADVRAALASLAPQMRAVVVLRFWLDLSVQDTADLLGCGQGTVKSQASKAAARLRDLLTDSPVTPVTPVTTAPPRRTS